MLGFLGTAASIILAVRGISFFLKGASGTNIKHGIGLDILIVVLMLISASTVCIMIGPFVDSGNMIMVAIIVLVVVFGVVLGLLTLCYRNTTYKRSLLCSANTIGRVIMDPKYIDGSTSYVGSFIIDGEIYFTQELVNYRGGHQYKLGDIIHIKYQPDNPKNNIIEEDDSSKAIKKAVILVFSIVAVCTLAFFALVPL